MILGNILKRNTKLYPKKESLIYEEQRFTWAETHDRVASLVNGLLNLGIQKGDRIAVLSDNSHRYLEVYLAAAQAGFIIVPLNAMFKPVELAALLKNADVSVLFCGKNYLKKKDVLRMALPEIKYFIGLENHDCLYDYEPLLKKSPSEDARIQVSPDDTFVIAYTSGTTGNAKGAVLTHRSCYTAALIHSLEWRVSQADNYLFPGRLFFAAGGPKFIPFVRGCKTVVTNFDAQGTLELIEREQISFFSTGPTIISLLTQHNSISDHSLKSIRSIGFTSAPMPSAIWEKANEVLGETGVSTYGLTETNATGLILQPEDVYPMNPSIRSKRFGSVGKSMILIDVRVVDADGKEISWGKDDVGEITIRGESVMKGYWKNPEASEKALKDGWFYTGDLATIDEDGFVYIVDRKKDIIISGGINISSREVEDVLYMHEAVNQAAVIGVPHKKWGETVKAVVVLNPGPEVGDEELMDFCKSNLASYKKPTSVDFLPDLPKTSSGKINKKELRGRYWKETKS